MNQLNFYDIVNNVLSGKSEQNPNENQEIRLIEATFPATHLKKQIEIPWTKIHGNKKIKNKNKVEHIFHENCDEKLNYFCNLFRKGKNIGVLSIYNMRWPKKQKIKLLCYTTVEYYPLMKEIIKDIGNGIGLKSTGFYEPSGKETKDIINSILPILENYKIERHILE